MYEYVCKNGKTVDDTGLLEVLDNLTSSLVIDFYYKLKLEKNTC